jgi:hypothetical protein
VKIQKQFVNKRGDKSYYKYVLVLNPELLSSSGFHSGDELTAEAKKGEIKLKKSEK